MVINMIKKVCKKEISVLFVLYLIILKHLIRKQESSFTIYLYCLITSFSTQKEIKSQGTDKKTPDNVKKDFGICGKEPINYSKTANLRSGKYYYNARWYDPSIGRFITEDPIKANSNWFIYASNNPLTRIDPTGLFDVISGLIEEGDTLSEITETLSEDLDGLSVEHLAEINEIEDPDKIKAGDHIENVLPDGVYPGDVPSGSAGKNSDQQALANLKILTLPVEAMDQVMNDNPYLRMISGGVEVGGAVANPNAWSIFLGLDGLTRFASGLGESITELMTKEDSSTPSITNIGSVMGITLDGILGNKNARSLSDFFYVKEFNLF